MEKFPLTLIKLRDGRLVPYDKDRVSAQVMAAAQAVGKEDPLWPTEVAEAVTLYLRRRETAGVPTEEQVEEAVVKILLRTGHVDMAKAYVLYRSQRRLEEAQIFDLNVAPHQLDLLETNEESILVRNLSGELFAWSRQGRVSAIVINSGLDPSIAEQLTLEVERMLRDADIVPVPLPLILFLHALKLIELGAGSFSDIDPVVVPTQLVQSLLNQGRFEDRVPRGAIEASGGYIVGQYAVSNVYPKAVRYAHYDGSLQINSPQMVNRFLSASWSPGTVRGIDYESFAPDQWLDLLSLPDRLTPYFAQIELPRFDQMLASLGADSGVIDLNISTLLGLRSWSTSTGRLVIGVGIGLDSAEAPDLSAYALTIARLLSRFDQQTELVVELGGSPDGGLVRELVEASGEAPLRFTGEREFDGGGVLGNPLASRVAVNLRRMSTSGVGMADQVGIEVIRHAVEAARVKAEFLRSVADMRSSGVLGGLVTELGHDWVVAAAGTVELDFIGLDGAVFELTGNWPSENEESLRLLERLSKKLVTAAQDFARSLGLTLIIRAGMDPALEEFFGMLDRTVLGLPAPPTPPVFVLSDDTGHLYRGPYAPAWPGGVSVVLWADSTPEAALACVKNALEAGAGSVIIGKGAPCTS